MTLEKNKIYNIDCREGIELLNRKSIDMCITSPPYWGLRDYGDKTVTIWDGDKTCEHSWKGYTRESNVWGTPNKNKYSEVQGSSEDNKAWIRDKTLHFCSKCDAWRGQLGLEPTFMLYIKHLCDIFDEVKFIMKPSGSCWVNIGDTYMGSGQDSGKNYGETSQSISGSRMVGVSPIINLPTLNKDNLLHNKCQVLVPFHFAIEMIKRGWILRNTVIWHKPAPMPSSVKDRFTVDFEYLFFFVKNQRYYFKQQREGNHNKPTTWSIPTQPFPGAHFAVFPEKLIETPIKAGCPEGGVVLDPFVGSGTSLVVAKKLRRQFIGSELNPEYVKIAENRISNTAVKRNTKLMEI